MGEIAELKHEVVLVREIPQRLCESMASCRDIYKDVLLTLQSFVPDGDSSIGKFLATTSEIGFSLFSNLEKCLSMAMDNHKSFNVNDSLVQENWKVLSERLKGTITFLALAEKLAVQNKEEKNNPTRGSAYKVAAWSQSSRYHLSIMILFFILIFGYVFPLFRISII
ncbi:hypothetical protein OIU84_013032 [Salix udensis]|uniref:Uncharacterized protein n=1 Tax=Salix udensis TaxID=889485 RepID=A0AAD6JIW4_9ROSI|nr:hypothetical protein OIU84_013032 [Salix udensis]